jgi:small redox-active disulfide protein 2
MKIEILSIGCPKCFSTEENLRKALSELSLAADIEKVTDIQAIKKRGVRPPALVFDGKLVLQGNIPTIEELKLLITEESKHQGK